MSPRNPRNLIAKYFKNPKNSQRNKKNVTKKSKKSVLTLIPHPAFTRILLWLVSNSLWVAHTEKRIRIKHNEQGARINNQDRDEQYSFLIHSVFPTFLFLYFYIGPANIRRNLLLPLRLQLLHLFSLFSKFAPLTLEGSISCKFYREEEMRSCPLFKIEPTCVNRAVNNYFLASQPY